MEIAPRGLPGRIRVMDNARLIDFTQVLQQIAYQKKIKKYFSADGTSPGLPEIVSAQMILFHFVMQQLPGNSNAFGGSANIPAGIDQGVDNRRFFTVCADFHQAFRGHFGHLMAR